MPLLRFATPAEWTETVLADFDTFMLDHAAAEKKASGMAMSMVSHYPDKAELIIAMTELAVEELTHYREVVKLIYARGLQLQADQKDAYVVQMRQHLRHGNDAYLLDRLLIAGIIEARGAERFGLIGAALPEGQLKTFYQAIARSEQRHQNLFVDLAAKYLPDAMLQSRLDELLDAEAVIVRDLPLRAALH